VNLLAEQGVGIVAGWLPGWKQEEKNLVSVVIMRGVGRGKNWL